jgi:hypothetical protein
MGTWDAGPFDNDGAADFLGEGGGSPQAIAKVLRRCADAAPDEYLDVDDGQPAIAACELVALGFGYGNLEKTPAKIRTIARALGPREDLRLLAIRAIETLRDSKRSEIAGLWAHDPSFDASLANLVERLTEAGD